jgi:hypothetical protein
MSKLAKHIRKLLIALGTASLVAVSVYADHSAVVTAQATQHPVNQSGAKGRINFMSVPGGLLVTGTATGLAPSVGRYVSLVYDLPSVPGGPTVCEPVEPIDGMFVGIWSVNSSGNGTLIQVVPPGEVAPLSVIDTISIRDTTINEGFGPEAVVACGEIAVHGGR